MEAAVFKAIFFWGTGLFLMRETRPPLSFCSCLFLWVYLMKLLWPFDQLQNGTQEHSGDLVVLVSPFLFLSLFYSCLVEFFCIFFFIHVAESSKEHSNHYL
ncbi:hypothetical protein BDF14DRAFT_726132 [Spinellus fusiger]|nr:hypothetical protein BDF14DRAFT_726132 [Spinellus fusiger]